MDSVLHDMPLERLAWLLRRARSQAGLRKSVLASRVGVGVEAVRAWERGVEPPTAAQLSLIADAVGLTVDELLPPRGSVEIDLAGGVVSTGESSVAFAPDGGHDALLAAFVDAVYRSRDERRDQLITFRDEDLDVLGDATGLADDDLVERLIRVARLGAEEERRLRALARRRRVLMPLAGLALGALSLNSVGIGRDGPGDHDAAGHGTVEIGEGSVYEAPDVRGVAFDATEVSSTVIEAVVATADVGPTAFVVERYDAPPVADDGQSAAPDATPGDTAPDGDGDTSAPEATDRDPAPEADAGTGDETSIPVLDTTPSTEESDDPAATAPDDVADPDTVDEPDGELVTDPAEETVDEVVVDEPVVDDAAEEQSGDAVDEAELSGLPAAQLGMLSADQLAGLNPSHWKFLPTALIDDIPVTRMADAKPGHLKSMSAEQLAMLTADQINGLTDMTFDKIAEELTAEQVGWRH